MDFLSSIILFGILPSIGTYAVLPYSQRCLLYFKYYFTYFKSTFRINRCFYTKYIKIYYNIYSIYICYLYIVICIIVALLSPCPPLHDSIGGAILVVSCYFIAYLLLYYIKISYWKSNKTRIST